ncbi:YegP family protein [Pseudomonas lini]
MYFEIYRQTRGTAQTGKGQWRWRLRAGNHETIASGEAYVNKSDCVHAISLINGTEDQTPVKEI